MGLESLFFSAGRGGFVGLADIEKHQRTNI